MSNDELSFLEILVIKKKYPRTDLIAVAKDNGLTRSHDNIDDLIQYIYKHKGKRLFTRCDFGDDSESSANDYGNDIQQENSSNTNNNNSNVFSESSQFTLQGFPKPNRNAEYKHNEFVFVLFDQEMPYWPAQVKIGGTC